MRNAWIVARRELGAIFVQPIAYIFTIVVVGITGLIFAAQLANYAIQPGVVPVDLANVLGTFTFLYIFAAPAITMRLLSEEQRSGTMELLMTLPLRDGEVVLGKFMAAFIFYMVATALTLVYPFVLIQFGNPDIGPILTSYLGVLLWGAGLLAIGLLASALSDNQMVSFILGFGLILVLYLAFIPGRFFTASPTVALVFNELSFESHLNNFMRGLILAKDVVYYLGITAVFLFATTRVLESRRWR
ncbi:MAG: ABC transporter [Chloroflexi bacterium]|nr:MAG: ABC transporter [Chloroflexota bacterium]